MRACLSVRSLRVVNTARCFLCFALLFVLSFTLGCVPLCAGVFVRVPVCLPVICLFTCLYVWGRREEAEEELSLIHI